MERVKSIPVELICLNPDQPRKIFREEELLELRDSIKEFGIIQPILVKKDREGLFILIAGERRLRAAKLAGIEKVPAIVREMDGKDTALVALIENVQRENLNYIEEAYAYKKLMENYGLTQGEIARRVGKQQSTISNKIRILALPPEIREVLASEKLTERHARALLKIRDEEIRKNVLKRIVANELNVKQSEKLIADVMAKKEEEDRKHNKMHFISHKIYINTLRQAFEAISQVEEGACFRQEDKGEYIEVKITIPKKSQRVKECFT